METNELTRPEQEQAVLERPHALRRQIWQLARIIEGDLRDALPDSNLGDVEFDIDALAQDVAEFVNLKEAILDADGTLADGCCWNQRIEQAKMESRRLRDDLRPVRSLIRAHQVVEARRLLQGWILRLLESFASEGRLVPVSGNMRDALPK
jgi:hypothetical protein